MKKITAALVLLCISLPGVTQTQHDLHFDALPVRWDEAVPLGNGMLGALIWQKEDRLRFSLDRADLWDSRPMNGLHRKEFSYQWVTEQVEQRDYAPVQQYFDQPYDREPGPSKIPGGALEFETKTWGTVQSVHLYLSNALCEVKWESGVVLKTFVHATQPLGWFRFENITTDPDLQLIPPKYEGEVSASRGPVAGDDLARLGYKQGSIVRESDNITYKQTGWGGFSYEINVRWRKVDSKTIEGSWSISVENSREKIGKRALTLTRDALGKGYRASYASHVQWWEKFWSKSGVWLSDEQLEKQWWLEQYKLGSASRIGAPPISLQAVWTADNGRLPPWKGDYHHDLNTELSYWPAYSGNHLEEGIILLDHLDANRENYRRYTQMYFGKSGLAVPGVTTLDGTEMGGWIQYALSPTASGWLAHHYYLQWRYGMDKTFLKNRAYPWIKDVAIFFEGLTIRDANGKRRLPISSSPETNNNDLSAWFSENTNYDLALMRFTFQAAGELAAELGLTSEAAHWREVLSEFGDWALTKDNELMVAPQLPYKKSHRHFSHMLAIHPLGLIKWETGKKDQEIIQKSVDLLDSIGPDEWCGYSYSWLANMKARAKDGKGAAEALRIFSKAFCSTNSFHLNGDQTNSGYSKSNDRPFTLEGNFAFAAGLQEMLLQSHAGFIEVMPAVPMEWTNVRFDHLRAEGAFLVSATRTDGQVDEITIVSEKGGTARLKLPFQHWQIASRKGIEIRDTAEGFMKLTCKTGGMIVLKNDQ